MCVSVPGGLRSRLAYMTVLVPCSKRGIHVLRIRPAEVIVPMVVAGWIGSTKHICQVFVSS